MNLHLVALLAGCIAAFTAPAQAINVLDDGGNLPTAVAAAQDQDIIDLQSNGAFAGNLTRIRDGINVVDVGAHEFVPEPPAALIA
jgi:hypothetical protein